MDDLQTSQQYTKHYILKYTILVCKVKGQGNTNKVKVQHFRCFNLKHDFMTSQWCKIYFAPFPY